MPLDGLTIHVLVNELKPLLKNGRVLKIYQPEEATITMQLRVPGTTYTLLISADPVYPRLHLVEDQLPNPQTPPSFCMLLRKYLEPSRLLSIEQRGFDRVVRLRFEALDELGRPAELSLIFEVMSRQSNLYLVDAKDVIIDALKRSPGRDILPGRAYQAPPDQGKLEPTALEAGAFLDELRLLPVQTKVWRWLADSFQGLSTTAAQEVLHRAGLPPEATRGELAEADWYLVQQAWQNLLEEIASGGTPRYYPALDDFTAYTLSGQAGEPYPSVNSLVAQVLMERQRTKELTEAKGTLRRRVAQHLKRLSKKEAIHQLALQQAERAALLRHQGELLTAYFHLIPPGAEKVQVPDYLQGGQLVTIELDPRLSPSANVQRIFKRYHKAKASQKHSEELLAGVLEEKQYLESVLLQIEQADSLAILQDTEGELRRLGYLEAKTAKAKTRPAPSGPDRYVSPDGFTVLVGRNNQQNDELTFKLASPNHLWLHARGTPGSHVAILAEGAIPEETLRFAAQLAAYYSAQRRSPKAEVDYTLRKYVRKPKGAKPGFVHYERAKTIVVDPTKFTPPPKH
ncbi:MAG TPA: NFACT RNA binding domain-containing protein [Limnochordia bacterium]|nr:NFACT RNA binding domain-containing protein [Limnochordia bacterium]